jgi:hypothetical protein
MAVPPSWIRDGDAASRRRSRGGKGFAWALEQLDVGFVLACQVRVLEEYDAPCPTSAARRFNSPPVVPVAWLQRR